MKWIHALGLTFAALGTSVTIVCAQTNAPKKRTIWIPPPMGSHLGGGFVDSGEVNNESATKLETAKEDRALGIAIAKLDAKARTAVDGWALMPSAVSWQIKVPVEVLKGQRATSGLTYGELLVANSLATGSGNSFEQILAFRAKHENWSQLARKLHIGVGSLIARLKAADESIQYADYRRKIRRDQNFKETEFQR